ncbi:helix-turn-helix domain-containing protein [Mogibacterium sp.]|uniref:helix-turn-helix domain-containing protein n=1 Tax=Mogibacterium sp. TaxID=2049035 RepID=UPI002580D060|nr:helix-turn-helix domain-containing protein [Mogibacterium sp.]
MKGTHLTLEDRKYIQHGLEEGLSKAKIARELGKSPSTVSKEVKKHRTFKCANAYGRGIRYFCENVDTLKQSFGCKKECKNFKERGCKRREKIGACNHCPENQKCGLNKYYYHAAKAHEIYLNTFSDSREGVNMTSARMIMIADIIGSLLKKGQSIYQIVQNHPEIGLSVKSIYTYIEYGIFLTQWIDTFSLRRQVSMRKRKPPKPRKEPVCYDGFKYEDYLEFKAANPNIPTTEMDTVFNVLEGPYIQTFIFENAPVMIGFLHREKTSASMASTLDMLPDTHLLLLSIASISSFSSSMHSTERSAIAITASFIFFSLHRWDKQYEN